MSDPANDAILQDIVNAHLEDLAAVLAPAMGVYAKLTLVVQNTLDGQPVIFCPTDLQSVENDVRMVRVSYQERN